VTPITDLLARALLLDKQDAPTDVVPYPEPGALCPIGGSAEWAAGPSSRARTSGRAANDLQTLCETVVTHTGAALQNFISDNLPEPPGARVLGCILQLTGAEDSARFWWQYAASAGDSTASYSLYLQHLSLGDPKAAAWWRRQTHVDTTPAPERMPLPHDPSQSIEDVDAVSRPHSTC
jgi:hypothetical protein